RDLATSGRAYCAREYVGPEVDHLWAPWLLHAGLSPDHASGGFMVPVLAATIHGFGLPVVEGGAGQLVQALRGLCYALSVLVHSWAGSASPGHAGAEAEAHRLPRRPTVVLRQQFLLDPSRVPAGAAALWLQLQEVPFAPAGDADGELDTTGGWTPELARAYA